MAPFHTVLMLALAAALGGCAEDVEGAYDVALSLALEPFADATPPRLEVGKRMHQKRREHSVTFAPAGVHPAARGPAELSRVSSSRARKRFTSD